MLLDYIQKNTLHAISFPKGPCMRADTWCLFVKVALTYSVVRFHSTPSSMSSLS